MDCAPRFKGANADTHFQKKNLSVYGNINILWLTMTGPLMTQSMHTKAIHVHIFFSCWKAANTQVQY